MTRKTVLALLAQADATLPDNTAQAISAEDVRLMVKDVIDTFAPGYGIISTDSITLAALGVTPRAIPFTDILAQTPEYTVVLAQGSVTRLAQGLPTTVNRISFYCDVSAPAGDELVFSLFRNGVDIPGGITVSGQGIGNRVQAAFSIGTTSPDGADYTYDIRASKLTGGADDVELNSVRFILESVPTLGI
jgi:hypothetical protein